MLAWVSVDPGDCTWLRVCTWLVLGDELRVGLLVLAWDTLGVLVLLAVPVPDPVRVVVPVALPFWDAVGVALCDLVSVEV